MAEITDGPITDQDVGQAPELAGEGRPEDPAQSSPESIKAKLVEPGGTAAGMSFGKEEPSSLDTASATIAGLTQALGQSDSQTAQLTGQLAVAEVSSAIVDAGIDPAEAIAAGLASGALSQSDADEIAWRSALAAEGLTDEELDELGDVELDEQIVESSERLMAQAKALANEQDRAKVYSQTYSEEFAKGVKNHEASIKALREYQAEIGATGPEMEALLVGIDVELSSGILGQPLDLDQVAISDPKLFAASLRAAGSVILQDLDQEDAAALKARILAQETDISSGLTIDGRAVREKPQPGFNEDRYVAAVSRRAKKGPYDGPVNLPAERSIRSGFTSNGRPIHPDDLPIGDRDGGTAKSRLQHALRGGKL